MLEKTRMALEGASSMLPVRGSLKIIEFFWFSQIFPNRFRVRALPQFSTSSWILPTRSSSFKITLNSGFSSHLTHSAQTVSCCGKFPSLLSGCLDPLSALLPLYARSVSWRGKMHFQKCLAAAVFPKNFF